MTKEELERFVFEGFSGVLRSSGRAVSPESIQQRKPPFPDITCDVDGVATGYELTLATTERLQQDAAHDPVFGGPIGGEATRAFNQKRSKRYPAFTGPIDLVIHEGLYARLDATEPWIEEFESEVANAIESTVFRAVWVVSYDGKTVFANVSRGVAP